MPSASEFLKDQNEDMAKEIADGSAADRLKERLKKITLANEVIDLGKPRSWSQTSAVPARRTIQAMVGRDPNAIFPEKS